MEILLFLALCIIAAALFFAAKLYARKKRQPPPRIDLPPAEHYAQQFSAVTGQGVTFRKSRIMGRGEYELFRAALTVTGQPMPRGEYPFYVFPQVSLGQITSHRPGDRQGGRRRLSGDQ